MTAPGQLALEICQKHLCSSCRYFPEPGQAIAAAITAAVDEARLEERGACAKVTNTIAKNFRLDASDRERGSSDRDNSLYIAECFDEATSKIRARSKGDAAK